MSLRIAALVAVLAIAAPAARAGTLNVQPSPPRATDATPPAAPAPDSQDHSATRAAPREPTIGGRTEAEWRDGALARQNAVESAEEALSTCEAHEAPAPYRDYAGYVKPIARRPGYQWVAIKTCDDTRHDLDEARRDLTSYEEQARRNGVPPGWLR